MVDHMLRRYLKRYMLLHQMNSIFLSQALWEKLKDQLLAGQYYSFIRPLGKVIEELEKEATPMAS